MFDFTIGVLIGTFSIIAYSTVSYYAISYYQNSIDNNDSDKKTKEYKLINIIKKYIDVFKDDFEYRYDKFKRIKRLVATNHKGSIKIFFVSIGMVLKVIWLRIIQYFNSSVTFIGNNKYVITYTVGGKIHKMLVKPNRGPSKIFSIHDENGENVSNIVGLYLGPEENFHKTLITPTFFNKKRLIFGLADRVEIFEENDYIKL